MKHERDIVTNNIGRQYKNREEIRVCHQVGEVPVPEAQEVGVVVQGVEAVVPEAVREDIAVHRIVAARLIEVLRVEAQQPDNVCDIISRQEYQRIFYQRQSL